MDIHKFPLNDCGSIFVCVIKLLIYFILQNHPKQVCNSILVRIIFNRFHNRINPADNQIVFFKFFLSIKIQILFWCQPTQPILKTSLIKLGFPNYHLMNVCCQSVVINFTIVCLSDGFSQTLITLKH